jgi:hypothetical protein
MKTLVIDDLRSMRDEDAHDSETTYARTPSDGIAQLYLGHPWDLIYLDYDLGYDLTTGPLDIWPCMEYIRHNPDDFRDTIFYIITSNPFGAEQMERVLKAEGLTAHRIGLVEKDRLFVGGY